MSKPKLIEQIENAGGVFVATRGTTTYQEVKDAYDGGKDVIVTYSNAIYELVTIPTGKNQLMFQKRDFQNDGYATTFYHYILLNTNNSWSISYGASNEKVSSNLVGNGLTPISSTTGYYRPIRLSTEEPTASDGDIGDIWIQYEA